MRVTLAAWTIALLIAPIAQAFDVTRCGQLVPAGEDGVLQNDIDCTVTPGSCGEEGTACLVDGDCPGEREACVRSRGVRMGQKARLGLNGHSISGTEIGVECFACEVTGPGAIFATTEGILGDVVALADLDLHDNVNGVSCGASPRRIVRATNVRTFRNSLSGFSNPRRLRLVDVSAADNGAYGVGATVLVARGLVATGNGGAGVNGMKARLLDSTITGNDAYGAGVDIDTTARPRVVDTVCGRSTQHVGGFTPGPSWNVCAGD